MKINVAKDFSTCPGGRLKSSGAFSAEEFRDEILVPKFQEAIKQNDNLEIDLSGSSGYASSFLEESFGGLVRSVPSGYTADAWEKEIVLRVSIMCPDDHDCCLEAIYCIQDALSR